MSSFFNRLKKIILRQTLVVFLAGLAFFGIQAFYDNSMLLAKADTVKTPEGVYYKGTPDSGAIRNDRQVENAQRKLRENAENIRDRLNLNEETPEATKEFLESTQRRFEETVEPITGSRHGYYQENIPNVEPNAETQRGYYQENLPPNVTPERLLRDSR